MAQARLVDSARSRDSPDFLPRARSEVLISGENALTARRARLPLIGVLVLLALAASIMHGRFHPPWGGSDGLSFPNTVAFAFCMADLFGVTLLFLFRKTVALAALLNGMIAIYGSVMMIHHGIATGSVSNHMPHVAIAFADLLTGIALLRVMMSLPAPEPARTPAQ
jgi:hypothetical protein